MFNKKSCELKKSYCFLTIVFFYFYSNLFTISSYTIKTKNIVKNLDFRIQFEQDFGSYFLHIQFIKLFS